MTALSYLAFAALALVGPGLGLQRWLRVRPDPHLVLPVGLAACAGAYGLSLVLGIPILFPGILLALTAGLLAGGPRGWAEGPGLRRALPPAAAVVLVLAVTDYGVNRVGPGGGFVLDLTETVDAAFHVGLAWELSHSYPPQVPGLSGVTLGYHLGQDLVRAAALRFAHIHPYDGLSRYDVTLAALALLLSLRGAVFVLGGGARAQSLAAFAPLLCDFSFLALLLNPEARWWASLLNGNLLPSLILANGTIPALAIALGSAVALSRHDAGEGRGFLWIAAVLAAAVPFFKVFLAAQYAGALGVAFLLGRRRGATAAVALPCLVATASLVLGEAGRPVQVLFDPLRLVANSLNTLDLGRPRGLALAGWSVAWLLASWGLRLVAVPEILRSLASRRTVPIALATLSFSGFVLGLTTRITLREQPGYDEAAYFVEQSGAVLWIFAALVLARWLPPGGRALPGLTAVVLLGLPASLEFIVRKAQPTPEGIPASVLSAMAALEAVSRPGDVVLEKPHLPFPPPPVVLIGRRVPYSAYIPYLMQFTREEVVTERHARVRAFFQAGDPRAAAEAAKALGARYLCLYEGDSLAFDPAALGRLVFEEEGTRVYAFAPAAQGSGSGRGSLRPSPP